jgi:hypothetical protein
MDDKSIEYGQQNFTLPHDVVPLPSKGVFYKNKKKAIKVGYLTASDENIIMGGADDLTINLLRNKIFEPDVRVEDLLEGDVEAILIFLRNTSFGPEITLNLKDPVTGKQFQATELLDSLPISQGQTPDDDGTFTTILPKSNVTVKLKPMTYGDILSINQMAETYPQGRVVPKVTWRLNKQIVSINGSTDKTEIAKFVEQMPITDSKYIRKFMDDNEPKLDLKKILKAPSGEPLTVNIGFGVEFFRPFF